METRRKYRRTIDPLPYVPPREKARNKGRPLNRARENARRLRRRRV